MNVPSPHSYQVESSFGVLGSNDLLGKSDSVAAPEADHTPAHAPRHTHTPTPLLPKHLQTREHLFYTPSRALCLHLTQH